jgi:hypothetical protein
MRMSLLGARTPEQAAGEDLQSGKANYFTGNDPAKWQHDVPMYGKVRMQGVYPGVDLKYYGHRGELEYDFVVAPGADASAIRLRFDGAKPTLAANGDLVLPVEGGPEVRFNKPVVYQTVDGVRQPVDRQFCHRGQQAGSRSASNWEPTTTAASWSSTPRCSSLAFLARATTRRRLSAWPWMRPAKSSSPAKPAT